MSSSKYAEMMDRLFRIGHVRPRTGFATIAIWRNLEHFQIWSEMNASDESNGGGELRVASLPLSFLTMIALPQGKTPAEIALLGIGFGESPSYSDTQLMYYVLLESSAKTCEVVEKKE